MVTLAFGISVYLWQKANPHTPKNIGMPIAFAMVCDVAIVIVICQTFW